MINYTREQFLELYNDLPQELQEAMGSDRATNTIERLSDQEELNNEEHSAFVKLTGDVLLGLVPVSQYGQELVESGIDKDSAEKIDQAVRRFIFYPVKDLLSGLYQEEIAKSSKPSKDSYREEVER